MNAAATAAHHAPTERGYASFVARHRRLIAGAALVGAAIAVLVLVRQPPAPVAAVRVALTAYEVAPGADLDRPTLISPDSDAQVLASLPVLGRAAARTGYPGGVDALEERLAVSAVPNSRILVVQVPDVDADRAVATADAIVEEFLAVRAAAAEARAGVARTALATRVARVSERLATLRASVPPGGVLTAGQRADEAQLSNELDDLQAAIARIASGSADPGFVLTPAAIARPAGPPPGLAIVVSGVLLGGVAGLGLSGLLDHRTPAQRRDVWRAPPDRLA